MAEAGDGSAVLAMELIDGSPLDDVDDDAVTDELLGRVWADVDHLHEARIAHRSLHTGNVLVADDGGPCVVDFSFSELAASERQLAVDRAELLASTSVRVGPDRAVASALRTIGADAVASTIPLLQPLALSASTRKALRGQGDLLSRTRAVAASATDRPADTIARVQRVRPRTLLMIAVVTAAFYFILPQLAQVGSAWQAFRSAHLAWVPVVIGMSVLTYVASAVGMLGTVPQRLAFGPTLIAQSASSFVNRVTPANVGGMALNARYLEKSGVDPASAVAGVGLNSIVGAIVHLVLIAVFLAWAGTSPGGSTFKLPSATKLLLVLPVVLALLGVVLLTRWGRRTLLGRVSRALRSAAGDLRKVASSPVKLALLFGGSAGVTLAYIGALAASVRAFGGGVGFAHVGAVYLGASAVASAAPTPGNLGALEAALVAGLTGVGMDGGESVSTVLTYRLATYWLPVLPGWLAWHVMQRRQDV